MKHSREPELHWLGWLVLAIIALLGLLLLAGSWGAQDYKLRLVGEHVSGPPPVVFVADREAGQFMTSCVSADEARAELVKRVPGVTFEKLPPEPYMLAFNALPPATAYPTPAVLIAARSARKLTVLLMGFNAAGCQMMIATLKIPQHEMLMRKIGPEI